MKTADYYYDALISVLLNLRLIRSTPKHFALITSLSRNALRVTLEKYR
jgi:hypothetical protein